ncbi:MAG: membrane integrity-associated transporter subunit PqiC [Candidatus Paracaedimonas acanthamoebae]|uniref:Membrane integrity-associated transporter subunit PqiC n=1 Tax=Candidatus Paracaedimonas acanthamoebae TaxID=244581 RepID=A0A8J7Q1C5_9PROT|nr:membrane integrity-associated transporter subunit PqiC [Candidatus Paracaedimonas acanthamoebae]
MRTLGLLFCVGLLAGCISVLPEEPAPAKKIVLIPKLRHKIVGHKIESYSILESLIVEKPRMLESLDSARVKIVLHGQDGVTSSEFVAGIEWSDKLPSFLQETLISLYERTGKITAVGRAEEQFYAPYRLQFTITNFEIVKEADASMKVVVKVSAKVINSQNRSVLAQHSFHQQVAVKEEGLEGIIKAFEKATSVSFSEIIQWTFEKIKREKR